MPKPIMIQPMFDGLDAVVFKPSDGRDRPGLYLEECSYQAAKYAVEHWHYSGCLPGAGQVSYGVWENGRFIGAIIFSIPSAQNTCMTYGLLNNKVCELSRFALAAHVNTVSQIGATALRLYRRDYPDILVLVSYADEEQEHLGKIYQAMNWVYEGTTDTSGGWYSFDGRLTHGKTVFNRYGTRSLDAVRKLYPGIVTKISRRPKHKYSYALTSSMRPRLLALSKPYPKCVGSAAVGTVANHATGDGPNPIPTLRKIFEGGEAVPEPSQLTLAV